MHDIIYPPYKLLMYVNIRTKMRDYAIVGYQDAKKQVLECLGNGHVDHEARDGIDVKNLLSTGAVSVEEVSTIIGRSRGTDYETSPHHMIKALDVHIIKTRHNGEDWYIKWYYVEPNSVFISVHN